MAVSKIVAGLILLIIYLIGILWFVPDIIRNYKFDSREKIFWLVIVVGGGPFGVLIYFFTFKWEEVNDDRN